MEAPIFQNPIQLSSAFRSPSFVNNEQAKVAWVKNMYGRLPAVTAKKLPRRSLLQFVVFNPILLNVHPVLGVPMQELMEPEVIRTQMLDSGVRIQGRTFIRIDIRITKLPHSCSCGIDIVDGEGPEAHEGNLVEVNYVCRRSNGYFVHSTVDQFSGASTPVILPLDEKEIIKGLKEVLVGMKVGGKRRALIPPSAGYINENLKPIPAEFGPRRSLLSHAKEPLVFEVQLLKVL